MNNLYIIIALLAASVTAVFAQTELKKPNRATDQDHSMCVDDGGVEKCLTVDGPTGNVSVPGDFAVTGSIVSGTFEATLGNGTVSGGSGGVIVDESITSADIDNGTITADDLGTNSVGSSEIQADAVGAAQINQSANVTVANFTATGNVNLNSLKHFAMQGSNDGDIDYQYSLDGTTITNGDVSNPSTGNYTIDLSSVFNSSNIVCTCTPITGIERLCTLISTGSEQVDIEIKSSSTGTNVSLPYHLICWGT